MCKYDGMRVAAFFKVVIYRNLGYQLTIKKQIKPD
jgi:hypothetical protein